MAHFAQLDDNNIVTQVITVSNDDIIDENGNELESIGISFCKKLFGENTVWKQTSYNNNLRVRYASVGFSYNEDLDAFISPKPFNSWILDDTQLNWISPIGNAPDLTEEQIQSNCIYIWDEEAYQADNTTGWVIVQN